LIHFASLVELELDFGEEDVEFAERDDLKSLILKIQGFLKSLIDSFDAGNVIKEGLPVAIIGPPNAGKSTLLNVLLNEERAIVTEIAGTTRDVIEDVLFIEGIKFRFIDTAGIRETKDIVESIGIERSKDAMRRAEIVLLLSDSLDSNEDFISEFDEEKIIRVRNKIDLVEKAANIDGLGISAKNNIGIDELKAAIVAKAKVKKQADTMLTNLRHFEHLVKANEALSEVLNGLDLGITGDFLAQDIRLSLHHLGEITGAISSDDLLANIFSKFCIGK
jgi:tRNA modification GTPase